MCVCVCVCVLLHTYIHTHIYLSIYLPFDLSSYLSLSLSPPNDSHLSLLLNISLDLYITQLPHERRVTTRPNAGKAEALITTAGLVELLESALFS